MHIDRVMPAWDLETRHAVEVDEAPAVVWDAVRRLDLRRSPAARTLLALRGIRSVRAGWDGLEAVGFGRVVEVPPEELAVVLVARPWRIRGGVVKMTGDEFTGFDEPGYAKVVWSYRLDALSGGATRLTTYTRVRCTSDTARRRFLRYWRFVGPFSALLRKETLRLIAADAGRDRPGAGN